MIVLASASPRRRELLGLLFPSFEVRPADCDERVPEGLSAAETVEYLSRLKGDAARALCGEDDWVISADTVVAVGNEILGKPRDEDDARRMIRLLSGREHLVFTGVTLTHGDRQVTFHVRTGVTFYPVPEMNWMPMSAPPSRTTRPAVMPFRAARRYGLKKSTAIITTWSGSPWRACTANC